MGRWSLRDRWVKMSPIVVMTFAAPPLWRLVWLDAESVSSTTTFWGRVDDRVTAWCRTGGAALAAGRESKFTVTESSCATPGALRFDVFVADEADALMISTTPAV
jgi:hypothetical protein